MVVKENDIKQLYSQQHARRYESEIKGQNHVIIQTRKLSYFDNYRLMGQRFRRSTSFFGH